MTAVTAVTSAMALRPSTALQRFSDYAVVRDNNYLYLGTDGDVRMRYNTTNDCLEINDRGSWVDARGVNLGSRICLEERFLRRPGVNNSLDTFTNPVTDAEMLAATLANKDFEILGGNASADDVTFAAEGGITLETDGGANTTDSVIVLPHLSTTQTAWSAVTWGTDREVRWSAVLRTGTTAQSVTSTVIWAGLKLTNVDTLATDDDSVFLRSDGTNWSTNYSIGGTDTTAAVLAIAQNTTYRLVIEIDSSRLARFYINGVLYATSTALTDATDLIPYIGVRQNLNGVARLVTVYHTAISRAAA